MVNDYLRTTRRAHAVVERVFWEMKIIASSGSKRRYVLHMSEMKAEASVTVIGDLVGSRRSADRAAVHARFARAIAAINADVRAPGAAAHRRG